MRKKFVSRGELAHMRTLLRKKELFNCSKVYKKQYDKMSEEERRKQSEELKDGGFAFDI